MPSQGSGGIGNAVVKETKAARLGTNHSLPPVRNRSINRVHHLFTGCEGGVLLLDGTLMVHFRSDLTSNKRRFGPICIDEIMAAGRENENQIPKRERRLIWADLDR